MSLPDIVGGVLLVAIIGAVGSGMGYMQRLEEVQRQEAEAFCKDARLVQHVLLAVDRTDPHSPEQGEILRAEIERAAGALAPGGKLTIVPILDTDSSAAEPYFSQCRPKRDVDVDPMRANQRMAQAVYEATFATPVREEAAQLAAPEESASSPIMEVIAAASQRPDFQRTVQDRTLVIFADMLQHRPPDFTQYSYAPEATDYAAFASLPYAGTVAVDLEGVGAIVLYRHNSKAAKYQTEAHRRFWVQWFRAAGVGAVTVVEVP